MLEECGVVLTVRPVGPVDPEPLGAEDALKGDAPIALFAVTPMDNGNSVLLLGRSTSRGTTLWAWKLQCGSRWLNRDVRILVSCQLAQRDACVTAVWTEPVAVRYFGKRHR